MTTQLSSKIKKGHAMMHVQWYVCVVPYVCDIDFASMQTPIISAI